MSVIEELGLRDISELPEGILVKLVKRERLLAQRAFSLLRQQHFIVFLGLSHATALARQSRSRAGSVTAS
jgi:hypothetical protein